MEDHQIILYPKSRRATFDVGYFGGRKHDVLGLIEIDVTEAREKLQASKEVGQRIGFTAWLIKQIADTVAEHPEVHALAIGNERLVAFDEVDVSLAIEREVEGVKVPLAAIIRKANQKSTREIDQEIQTYRTGLLDDPAQRVLTERRHRFSTGLFFSLPGWMRRLVWRWLLRSPFSIKRNMGTLIVTNPGMFSSAPGWVIPKTLHNLAIGVGPVCKKPWVIHDQVEVRQILHLTLMFNHNVIDGAPAARFTNRLVERLESAQGL
ncbi:MAG: 2-oxo acid dehydrogenase subunit E2 [bacterium]|nr:2-oxo acid dehydrogenase subunit E2 [bacterium]